MEFVRSELTKPEIDVKFEKRDKTVLVIVVEITLEKNDLKIFTKTE